MSRMEKRRVRGKCGQRRHRSDCACALSDQGLRCPLTEALDTVGYINIEQSLLSDCAASLSDQDFFLFTYAPNTRRCKVVAQIWGRGKQKVTVFTIISGHLNSLLTMRVLQVEYKLILLSVDVSDEKSSENNSKIT